MNITIFSHGRNCNKSTAVSQFNACKYKFDYNTHTCIIRTLTLRRKSWEKLICIICTRSTQPVQIYLLAQSALISEFNSFHCTFFNKNYKTLDLTYLWTTFLLGPFCVTQICYGEPERCLFMENTIRMCSKKHIFSTLMIVWRE